jgi:D-alanyl-D-alanine carboxypeptidase
VLAAYLWAQRSPADTPPSPTTQNTQTQRPTPAPILPASFNKSAHSTTDPASIWVVVNKQHPLQPQTYAPTDLQTVGGGHYLRAEAAAALAQMIAGAKQAGLTITPASGYRSYATQTTVYNNEVAANGQDRADSQSARPGYSEHQTGLAVDIAGGGCSIDDCFGDTAEGKWTAANAYKYGYILRYVADSTTVTGYRGEAWHFRYVGSDLATEMHSRGILTLEEFFGISGGTGY